ncbi:hypothetical protein A1O1_04288 [Capronia coronata CBS 617.96]|uniref:Zn(2)-C6 fungal-type domain-containing protein n=1 Tax=Capronia coronata CBS 617.96 TaxID=1182541 RepID=W9Z9I4_9EURO|nr:uncharacterized protein A1O1_04288 [Capronia coronata CBS 617.96]EXJ91179.1 hypothetical protein A1O1_04288 [Capronia coronata CBS 617.96]
MTCRARRKKCNEQRPRCEKCVKSNRACLWPDEDDLFDRRHRRVSKSPRLSPKSPELTKTGRKPSVTAQSATNRRGQSLLVCREICFKTDLFNSAMFKSDLEVDCMRHFFDGFLPLLILSNAHPGFYSAYVPEVVDMLLQFDGLKDVALACGASHLHLATGSPQMNESGLVYYSRAVSKVNQALNKIDWSRDDYNVAVLLAITFLYIHGAFALHTNGDIPKHVMGAVQLINLQYAQSRKPPLARPIHRIIWESILYQMFRQTVRRPFSVGFQPDFDFVARAEGVLQSLTFPDASPADNSPVIGIPLDLQKLIIEVVQLCKSPFVPRPEVLRDLEIRMKHWEGTILEDGHCIKQERHTSLMSTPSDRAGVFYQHSTSLHILAASLLLDWVSRCHEVPCGAEPHLPTPCNSWQVRKALHIMRCPQANEDWLRCYLGSWPSLIFGYAVDKPEEVALIRSDLQQRFQKLYSSEELLFLAELESVWHARGIGH